MTSYGLAACRLLALHFQHPAGPGLGAGHERQLDKKSLEASGALPPPEQAVSARLGPEISTNTYLSFP